MGCLRRGRAPVSLSDGALDLVVGARGAVSTGSVGLAWSCARGTASTGSVGSCGCGRSCQQRKSFCRSLRVSCSVGSGDG
ncbi:hypothetical protein PanWU01x14_024220 [Parasponia andersonii]|uniref:Uncharacterized protein n=1 Tax=Parasponia andersonii TaxID=3476 RepID=A0A2P5DWJ7_PARAD|nr:hypothetical protein PanWU01x14_024220 [Parasponia andersonii]